MIQKNREERLKMRFKNRMAGFVLVVALVSALVSGCTTTGSELEADVVVVGGGGAGLAAAIEAADQGASVILLEKMAYLGGNTRICGGLVPGAGTELQRAAGIEDSPEKYAQDIMKANGNTGDPELVRVATEEAADFVPWFESLGAKFLKVVPFPGNSVDRLHLEESLSGAGLVQVLEEAARARNVEIMLETTATSLVKDVNGAITGVKATTKDGKEITVGAKAVVLAAGGYAGNKEMLAEYIPVMENAGLLGHPGNVGDGIRMGIEAGADVRCIDAYCPHAAVNPEKTLLITWEMIMRGGIIINEQGNRFVDETIGYAKCAPELAQQSNGRGYLIFDGNVASQVEKTASYQSVIKEAASIEELADTIGVDKANLAATIETYNNAAIEGQDEFGRTTFGKPFEGTLYSIEVNSYLLFTTGGLRIDTEARVIDTEGEVIPGLYAAGENAGTTVAGEGYSGYITGEGLLSAFAFGRIAGRNAGQLGK
jgi:fumarate reductase flavoprotein subunit